MDFESRGKAIFWLLLTFALVFAIQLYPGPDARARSLLSQGDVPETVRADQAGAKNAISATADEVRAVESMARRGWFANLVFLVTGAGAAATWLLFRRSRAALVVTLLLLLLFVLLFLLAVIPSRLNDPTRWFRLMRDVASVGGWSFLLAELHWLLAFLVGLAATGVTVMSFRRLGRPALP